MTEPKDSLTTLTNLTGLGREDFRVIWAEVKANQALLDSCKLHSFAEIAPAKLGSKWKCSQCGGTVDSHAALWYKRGLTHATEPV